MAYILKEDKKLEYPILGTPYSFVKVKDGSQND
jgi:hypothetical protein